jgi:hypothetical protein
MINKRKVVYLAGLRKLEYRKESTKRGVVGNTY